MWSTVCCCSPSVSRFEMWSIQRCSSTNVACSKWLELPSFRLKAVTPLSFDFWRLQHIFPTRTVAHSIVSLFRLEMIVCWNPSISAVCKIFRTAHVAPTTHVTFKLSKSPFFLTLSLNFCRWSWLCLHV